MKLAMSMQSGRLDELSEKLFNISGEILMDNAATAIFNNISSRVTKDKTFAVFCGRGKNGGDGFLVACKLSDAGYKVKTVLAFDSGDNINPLTKNAMEIAARKSIPLLSLDTFGGADIYIDAILGTGFQGEIGGFYKYAIEVINKGKYIISVAYTKWRVNNIDYIVNTSDNR